MTAQTKQQIDLSGAQITPSTTVTYGRLPGEAVAIIDIGSNSVRLVIFERLSRILTTLFNEKLQAGLGLGVSRDGRLDDAAMERALGALRRFKLLCANADVTRLHVIATAAVRDAENGADFLSAVESILGVPTSLLSGREEAYNAALGVLAGVWKPEGLVADMGGGSLDIVDITDGQVGSGETFALGGLRLSVDADNDLSRARALTDERLKASELIQCSLGQSLYLIGGNWRSLAKLHMAETDYPIRVMQDYQVDASQMSAFCQALIDGDLADNPSMQTISKSRRALLPYGAVVLQRLIALTKAKRVVLSAFGVREGFLFAALDPAVRAEDPLLASCQMLAQLRSRSLDHIAELEGWLAQVAQALDFDQTDDTERLRKAVSLLADIGWRGHPDHRPVSSLADIAYAPLAGVDHPGRAFLALTIYYRYAGLAEPTNPLERDLRALLKDRADLYRSARIFASAMRLGYVLSASMHGTLGQCTVVRRDDDVIEVGLPGHLSALNGERLKKRSVHFSREINLPVEIKVDGAL